jgi:hypothetical protein
MVRAGYSTGSGPCVKKPEVNLRTMTGSRPASVAGLLALQWYGWIVYALFLLLLFVAGCRFLLGDNLILDFIVLVLSKDLLVHQVILATIRTIFHDCL